MENVSNKNEETQKVKVYFKQVTNEKRDKVFILINKEAYIL